MTALVLFVDDDDANLLVFEAVCGDVFPILTASSASDALALLEVNEVGVLMTDQRMPGQSGVELLEQARMRHPETVRILVTAYSDLDAAIDSINRGQVRRYLRKPWKPEELRAELRDALDVYRMRQQVRVLEARLFETERVYALGVVAAGVGHELRNPVAWMASSLEMVRRMVGNAAAALERSDADCAGARELLGKVDRYMDDVDLGIERIMEVVRGLEMPVRRDHRDEVDLNEVLELAMRISRTELRRSCLVEVTSEEVPPVRGSKDSVGQIILNLLVNALDAVRAAAPETARVEVRLFADEGSAYLEVMDSGDGIEPGDLERVFNPFFTTKGSEGTGLGLAISRRIAREMGGEIHAENHAEGGALFRLRLPFGDSVRPPA